MRRSRQPLPIEQFDDRLRHQRHRRRRGLFQRRHLAEQIGQRQRQLAAQHLRRDDMLRHGVGAQIPRRRVPRRVGKEVEHLPTRQRTQRAAHRSNDMRRRQAPQGQIVARRRTLCRIEPMRQRPLRFLLRLARRALRTPFALLN